MSARDRTRGDVEIASRLAVRRRLATLGLARLRGDGSVAVGASPDVLSSNPFFTLRPTPRPTPATPLPTFAAPAA